MAGDQSVNGHPASVITVSDRSARGERIDASGPAAVEVLAAAGYDAASVIVPDGAESVTRAIRAALSAGARIVLTSGGTGVGPRDETPEGTRPLLDYEIPGVGEALRRHGAASVATAVLSRGLAGVATGAGGARAVVVNLPGSRAGVVESLEVLVPLLPHLLSQLDGGDH